MTEPLSDVLYSHVSSNPPQKVTTLFVGQAFTAVQLASGKLGLALTPLTRFDSCIGATKLAGTLAQRDSSQLAQLLASGNAHLRAVGLAAVNAILQEELEHRSDFLEGDFLEFLEIEPCDKVAMIDYYTTKIKSLMDAKLTIFDNRFVGRRKDVAIFPLSDLSERLSRFDVVILPPTFIDRIEEFRRYASSARAFVVVHPTTPPLPEPFFERGVTMVASMMILNPDSVLRCVMEGGGTTMFKRFCRKIAFKDG